MTTLMDTVRIEAPMRSPVRPASPIGPLVGQRFRVTIPRALVQGRVSRRIPSYPVGAIGDDSCGGLDDEPWGALAKSSILLG
jgi:hypothetical protein